MVGLATSASATEHPRKKGEFLTPAELAELGEKSKVSYGSKSVASSADLPVYQPPGFPKDGPLKGTPYPEISRGDNGSRSLTSYQLSPVAKKVLEEAEPLFQANDYKQALAIYLDAVSKDPKCYVLYLSIGDCYLFSGNPVAALENYDKAIELNADDYHGYWFRASALLDLGKPEEARHAYARALAMSPGKPSLLKAINASSSRLGIHAREELFHPQAMARPEGDAYVVYFVDTTYWWLYGMCRAVWLAEEGHRMELTGKPEHKWTSTEELECTFILLMRYRTERDKEGAREPQLDFLLEIFDSEQLDAFVNYDFASRVTSDYAILLDDKSQEKMTKFVEQFVFQKDVRMVRPARFELATFGFVVRRSIQLSYGRTPGQGLLEAEVYHV